MIAGPVAGIQDLGNAFAQLGFFVLTVVIALVAHLLIMFIIYAAATRRNPFAVLRYVFRPWIIVFTTLAP